MLSHRIRKAPALTLTDAFDIGGVEGIKRPAALALLLRADLRGLAEWEGERLFQRRLSLDLAADVADSPACLLRSRRNCG